jgi:hypothetical protein
MQSINQLHVFLAREEPKKGATPKPPLVIPELMPRVEMPVSMLTRTNGP